MRYSRYADSRFSFRLRQSNIPLSESIRNVQITLTDANGNERTAQTTAFGYYHFEEVMAGETVTLSAKARRFNFVQSSIVRQPTNQFVDADFVSLPY
jgi:phosphatidate phosphatase APP1